MLLQDLLTILPNSYIVGGYVRDSLLKRPFNDVDITTSALPHEVIALCPDNYKLGIKFGTVVVKTEDYGYCDVTTMRRDITAGRHPEVEFTTDITTDLSRRGLRIDAMAIEPESGELIDPFNGQDDLKNKILQTPLDPTDTLSDDPLRALIIVRRKITLGFTIAPELENALLKCKLDEISGDRIRKELERMFEIDPVLAITELYSYGLLDQILPEVSIMRGFHQRKDRHPEGDVFVHTMVCVSHGQSKDFIQVMCILLHDVGKPVAFDCGHYRGHDKDGVPLADNIMRRLGCSTFERECVKFCVANHMKIAHFNELRTSKKITMCKSPFIEFLINTHEADCMGRPKLCSANEVRDFMKVMQLRIDPLITGRDLINAGLKPGPIFGMIKQRIEELQVEGEIKTKAEALKHAIDIYTEWESNS